MTEPAEIALKRRKTKLWHIALLLLGVLAVAFGVFRIVVLAKLRARIDGMRAAGYPVTFEELDDWYEVPTFGANAADYITTAFTYLRLPEREEREPIPLFGRAKLPPRTQPLDEQTNALIGKILQDNETALELLHEGASIPHCRYPIDLAEGHAAVLPHIEHFRNAVRLLSLEAIRHAERNEPQDAVRAIVSALGVTRSLIKEPVPISQLVRQGCQSSAVSTLEFIINRAPLTDEQLIQLEQAFASAYDPNALIRAFVGECCFGLAVFRNPRMMVDLFPTGGRASLVVVELSRAIGFLDTSEVLYIDLMEEAIQAAQLPPHERPAAGKAIEQKRAQINKAHVLLHELTPALRRLLELDLIDMARILTVRVALSVERYRRATGQLPGQLGDLVPRYLDCVPPDPFDGRPLRYTKLEKGYVIYSVGTDGEDNGGREKPPRRRGSDPPPNYDITFIVER